MRAKMLVPEDAHLTMINAANKGNTPVRKCWGEMLTAWSAFAHRHPEAYLYIHSDASGMANGVPLEDARKFAGHSQSSTTSRYSRGTTEAIARTLAAQSEAA